MSEFNPKLLEYIQEQSQAGVPPGRIKHVLLENDWPEGAINDALVAAGLLVTTDFTNAALDDNTPQNTFSNSSITMDKIIEKFIPIAGALLLIIGFGYLIYANAWVNLSMEMRIGLGFFFGVTIIGGSFSFSEKMRYFTDIGIGSGVLLLYGTLIYGSRATELASAMIPELVTLFTALVFTIAVSYFASKRNSKVILILGMLGAYITPFVIGQNDVWVENISFNAYLIYFLAVNIAVFLMGREISVRDIIPLNIGGLFVGVSTLWGLSMSRDINALQTQNFFTSEFFTATLFAGLVIFSIWSILISAKRFAQKDDGYLSLGYIAPSIWFAFNVNNLQSLPDAAVGLLYAVISVSCFVGWHVLIVTKTRFQHTALYAAGLIAAFLAVVSFFQEFDVFTSMLIAYSSLVFGFLYLLDYEKGERFISFALVSLAGSILSVQHIVEVEIPFQTLLVVIALLPAMSAYFIARKGNKKEFIPLAGLYSAISALVAAMFVVSEFIEYVDIQFLLFYVVPLAVLGYIAYVSKFVPESMSYESRSNILRATMVWFAFGFSLVFFVLINSIYPAPTDTFILTQTEQPINWTMIKGIFATIILFVGLSISRMLQAEQVVKRPSFILVIFGFSTLLLTGNYIISALMNDFQVSVTQGGPRAIATTLWWVAIAIYMLYVGVKSGKKYHAEKLLGLMLLGITLLKVVLYDIATMGMQNKIIVLMIVGGGMLLFSYYVRSKNLLKNEEV